MKRYMNADLHRIFTRVPRFIVLAVLYAAIFFIITQAADGKTVYEFISGFLSYVNFFFGVIGLAELIFVYADDLKAKTMQVAIGTGISRNRVILAKWAEIAVLMLIDTLVMALLIIAAAATNGVGFTADVAGQFLILLLFGVIKVVGSVGFTMIFIFWTRSTVIGILVYLVTVSEIVSHLFGAVLEAGFLSNLHISGYTFSGLMQLSRARMMAGSFSFWYNFGMILYLAVFFLLTCLVFRKRELEF